MEPPAARLPEMVDVAVIGGGPAGATAARLLAAWGHAVWILCKAPGPAPALGETLPPSTRKLFQFLGILKEVDRGGFYRTSGNTVWWGESQERVAPYPVPSEAWGYQVERSRFDRLLLRLAEQAGARVCHGLVQGVDLSGRDGVRLRYRTAAGSSHQTGARFALDCSGRAGTIARQGFRTREAGYPTVAVSALWQAESGWGVPDPTHTLVESYRDGWAWSVPLDAGVRYFTVMVDPRRTGMKRKQGLNTLYLAELEKAARFGRLLDRGRLWGDPWACDASVYSARLFGGSRFLLVGDAASFIDPLSSHGVKKAMASAWMAAVVTNTWLKHPALRQAACDFYCERERQTYTGYLEESRRFFRKAARWHDHPFWMDRSFESEVRAPPEEGWETDPEVCAAFERLKEKEKVRLQCAAGMSLREKAEIRGREIVLATAVAGPRIPDGLRFAAGVNLPALVKLVGRRERVPDLFQEYNRAQPPVELPNFLTALSLLLARGVLIETH